jgi:hypothetical protein
MARMGASDGLLELNERPTIRGTISGACWFTLRTKERKGSRYNCVAFALGDLKCFWHDADINGYYWPNKFPSADTIEGWHAVFDYHSYRDTADATLEPEYEKIAIYGFTVKIPEHVARQKASGVWVSKLGKGKDIEHETLDSIQGDMYGQVIKIMKRKCKDGRRVLE